MAVWYCGSTKWSAVTAWAAATVYAVGDIRRQLATPTVGNERVWRCTTAGTSGGAEPAWTLTKGSTTNDNGVVWTEITGNETYGWTAAHRLIHNALPWMAAGDTLYVSNNHAASTTIAAITMTSPGTAGSRCRILCVNDSAAPPTALATTATETSTGGNATSGFNGFAYMYGVTISIGSTTGTPQMTFGGMATPWAWKLEACALILAGSNSTSRITVGTSSTGVDDQRLELVNTRFKFAGVGQGLAIRAPFRWTNSGPLLSGSSVPTTLFLTPAGIIVGTTEVYGVDLSDFGSGKNLVDVGAASHAEYFFRNCKLGSSVSITTGTVVGQGGVEVRMVNCDSADTNYRYYLQNYQGTITQETTIVRTGGANDGTTTFARKLVSTANTDFFLPLVLDDIVVWNDTTGSSKTATVEIVGDGITLTDAEIWLEVGYLGTSGFPLSSEANDAAADIMATPANQASSTETWTTTGMGTPVKQKLTATFTPQEKGPIRCRVMLAKASTTVYVDPEVAIA